MHTPERDEPSGSYWSAVGAACCPRYAPLTEDIRADVIIVGAGIVGLTAAEALAGAGMSVVVLEALRIGEQATGRSTAKVSSQHGLAYARLVRDFGEETARLYGQANQEAIDHIAGLVARGAIDCGFERKAAYLYADSSDSVRAVQDEASAAVALGLPASLVDDMPAPVPATVALRFHQQAQFNPVRYLAGLASIVAHDARIHETSRVVEIRRRSDDQGYRVGLAAGPCVEASDVVVATHLPIVPEGMFYARAHPFSHPMLAADIDGSRVPDGMFISADAPTRSFRTDSVDGVMRLIAVGSSFATGDTQAELACFHELEDFVRRHFGIEVPGWRWTNEDFLSIDGLPFIGPATSSADHLHVATGFGAWGITNGTVAGRLIADRILGRANPFEAMFDPSGHTMRAGGMEFLKRNVGSARHLVGDRIRTQPLDPDELEAGQAAVGKFAGETVAAWRDPAGALHVVSASCSHMGCIVGWNATDRSWDCPCHGSRFSPDGAVLHGPATEPLKASGAGRPPEPSGRESRR